MDVNPLAVILVENGSKGDRLLFRYPYDPHLTVEYMIFSQAKSTHFNYSLGMLEEHLTRSSTISYCGISGSVHSFPGKVLSNLFAVKSELCGEKFEIKINDIRFVGHPLLLYHHGEDKTGVSHESILSFNVVFALKASASHAIVDCYHEVSKRIAGALRHEERRVAYLSEETKIMTSTQDDMPSTLPNDIDATYQLILQKSQLARELRRIYEDLHKSGKLNIRINNWILISCCLPQKIYSLLETGLLIEPSDIYLCMGALRPYHAVLLRYNKEEILNALPLDSSSALKRLVSLASPLKSLQTLAADADLTLSHVFQLVGHLLYFGYATVIYPLCDSNIYVLAGSANSSSQSKLVDAFAETFESANLIEVMSEFSVPISLSQRRNPLSTPEEDAEEIQIIIWLLQHHLLIQLHTYVQIVVETESRGKSARSTSSKNMKGNRVTFTSRQSTPEDLNGTSLLRMPSDSDMASIVSDDALSSPPSHKSLSNKIHWSVDNILSVSLSSYEREAILVVDAASTPEDLDLFARVCKYFRGKHHLEEIMFLENVRRSTLLHLIDKFRSVLVTFEHEDSACSVFYKKCYS